MDEITPKRGLTFEHARRITGSPKAGTAQPVVCRVTRVTRTAVYYQDVTGGISSYLPPERFHEAVKRVLP